MYRQWGVEGITEPGKEKSLQVRAFVVTDPHYVDYNPPPVYFATLGPVFRRNPFEYKDHEFFESSSAEEPAYHVYDHKVFHRR